MNNKLSARQGVAAQVVRTPVLAEQCTQKIRQLASEMDQLPNLFLRVATDAKEQDLPTATLVIGMDGDGVPGQYNAELHLVVTRIGEEDERRTEEATPLQRGVDPADEGTKPELNS